MSSETWVRYCMVEYFPKCQFILCSRRRRKQSIECRSCWLNKRNERCVCVCEFQFEHYSVYFVVHLAFIWYGVLLTYVPMSTALWFFGRSEFVQFWISEILVYFCRCIKIHAIEWWLSNISFCSSLCFIWYSRHELCFASKWIDNGTK